MNLRGLLVAIGCCLSLGQASAEESAIAPDYSALQSPMLSALGIYQAQTNQSFFVDPPDIDRQFYIPFDRQRRSALLGDGVKVGVIGHGFNPYHPELRDMRTGRPGRVEIVTSEGSWSSLSLKMPMCQRTSSAEKFPPYAEVTRLANCEGKNAQHDNAVLAIIGGRMDNSGVNGIAPLADLAFASIKVDRNPDQGLPLATKMMVDHLEAGDVMLFEAQARFHMNDDNRYNKAFPELSAQGGPATMSKDVRQELERATRKGIIVILTAGNSGANLDPGHKTGDELTQAQLVDHARAFRNKPYIFVGASNPYSPERWPHSNYASFVNTYSWG